MKAKELVLQDITICLLPQKAVFLPGPDVLLIADWHLGKAAHFRRQGIAIPGVRPTDELERLSRLIAEYQPAVVVFLGDLFHSSINSDWSYFSRFIADRDRITFILTTGNHDILPADTWNGLPVTLTDIYQPIPQVLCTHIPMTTVPPGMLNLAGHIHPGYILRTDARQTFRLPCFYYREQRLILPAFGKLTGLYTGHYQPGTRVFPILNDEVIELPDGR